MNRLLEPSPRLQSGEYDVVGALANLADLGMAEIAGVVPGVEDHLARLRTLGVSPDDLAAITQAYIRAAWRVAAAEAEVIASLESKRPSDPTENTELADHILGFGHDVFGLLHGSMLDRASTHRSTTAARSDSAVARTAVAHVDIVSSTRLISAASDEAMQLMVDGLFIATQSAIRGNEVEAIKYMGDGVFLAGSDPREVALASLDCIERLGRDFDLSARAGLAFGPVVHRAGDIYGLAVNMAHSLTKSARPESLLADISTAPHLPRSMRSEFRCWRAAGSPQQRSAFEVLAA
jgi:adenylate cyclase